jgi:hypothetical protein
MDKSLFELKASHIQGYINTVNSNSSAIRKEASFFDMKI